MPALMPRPAARPQAALYKRMGAAVLADGARVQVATLAFFNLALFSGPLPPERASAVDPDDFLQTLRWALCVYVWGRSPRRLA